eukprot:3933779-Rhodomonas_salina.1
MSLWQATVQGLDQQTFRMIGSDGKGRTGDLGGVGQKCSGGDNVSNRGLGEACVHGATAVGDGGRDSIADHSFFEALEHLEKQEDLVEDCHDLEPDVNDRQEVEKTIIDLLECEPEPIDTNVWEDVDETEGLLPMKPTDSDTSQKSRSLPQRVPRSKEGKWVKVSGKGSGRESYKWVADVSAVDRQLSRILRRFWLHGTLRSGDLAGDWCTMMDMGWGALDSIQDLMAVCLKSGSDVSSVRISKIGMEELRLNHLLSLQEGKWIHSQVLNAWNALIAKDAGHVCFGSKVLASHLTWIMDSSFFDHLTGVKRGTRGNVLSISGFDPQRASRFVSRQDLSRLNRIIIPINLNNTHWITACFQCDSRTLWICDSLHGRHDLVVAHLKRWINEHCRLGHDSITVEYSQIERQVRDDCGVASMLFAAKESFGLQGLPPMTEGLKLRDFIAGSLMMGSIRIGKKRVASSSSAKLSPELSRNEIGAAIPEALQSKNKATAPELAASEPPGVHSDLSAPETRDEVHNALGNDSELLERFTRILGERIAAGEDHRVVVDEALESGDVQHWCAKYEGITWIPLKFRERTSSDTDVDGKGFVVASMQTGPKGGQFAVDAITSFLNDQHPGVAHLQELRTPRHKIARLKKRIKRANSDYAMYTSVAKDHNKVAGSHLGVATLVRIDLTESIRVVSLPELVDGRVLALLIGGHGVATKTLHVNVYQHVNDIDNYDEMRAVLDNIYTLVCWANSLGHNMILSGDLNATLNDMLRINYASGQSLGSGDRLLRDLFAATNATAAKGSDLITWKSKSGRQQATLDHILFWPPTLRNTDAGVRWLEDSRFDHGVRWAEFNGNDVGFGVDMDPTRTPFVPKLKLTKCKEMREEMRMRGENMAHDSATKIIDGNLSETDLQTLWKKIGGSLQLFKSTASEVVGYTKEPTGKTAMKLPGHEQLHREVQHIREIRKETFLTSKLRRDREQPALCELYQKLRR